MIENFNPVQTTPYGIGYKIQSRVWGIINATLFRLTPFFMRRTRVAMLRLFGADVDWSCSISGGAEIVDPWNLKMGRLSSIDEGCCIRCRGRVIIGEKCCISRDVYFISGSHNINSPNFELVTAPIVIEDKAWIATRSVISKGVKVGEGAVVAAMSNVIKDVEPWTVVGGNPANFIKKRVLRNE
ncbi:MAG: putative colanic acid biosynthesis acetyltransferase [Bacteroidaceae bacterium]|nr:putative colanic acid biosynthesis acetyltransferase [Bacteroidaceae bacterium]